MNHPSYVFPLKPQRTGLSKHKNYNVSSAIPSILTSENHHTLIYPPPPILYRTSISSPLPTSSIYRILRRLTHIEEEFSVALLGFLRTRLRRLSGIYKINSVTITIFLADEEGRLHWTINNWKLYMVTSKRKSNKLFLNKSYDFFHQPNFRQLIKSSLLSFCSAIETPLTLVEPTHILLKIF